MAEEFAKKVEDEVKDTGLPDSIVLAKNLISRVLDAKKAEDGEEPEEKPKGGDDFVLRAKAALEGRKNALKNRFVPVPGGPQKGELLSRGMLDMMMIPLADIKEDMMFINTRLNEDVLNPDWSSTEGQTMENLENSMREEGLKLPIIVIPTPDAKAFFIRAGFRRTKCAKRLRWKEIPAIILERRDEADEYWVNILENSTRKTLRAYEVARAAKLMRDKFGVRPEVFAAKTGYSVSHIKALLGCIDRLPDELLEQWKNGARLAFEEWQKLSLLEPQNAIKYFRRWTGQGAADRMRELEQNREKRKLAPAAWLDRMQRLHIGLEGSELNPRTRDLCLRVVEFCMGGISSIPGVYEPRKRREYEKRAMLRSQLKLPELPGPDERQQDMPPPVSEVEDDDQD